MRFGAIQEFQGLKFTTDVNTEASIAAVVGRNGSGKSRLLQAIHEGNVEVYLDAGVVPREAIRLLRLHDLQPSLGSGYDPVQQTERRRQAIEVYRAHKGKFGVDPLQTVAAIGVRNGMQRLSSTVNVHQLAEAVSQASRELGKDPNELSNEDVWDYFSIAGFASMGSLNVTGIVRAYLDRQEENNYAQYRNQMHGESRPYWNADQFAERLGPQPWVAINGFLNEIFDGQYYIKTPTQENVDTYDGRLYRTKDNVVVDPSWLSSGEKVLMWLCLSMYATKSQRPSTPPKLLLLDEPDGSLHPGMVQKLHKVLRSIVDHFGTGILFTSHSPTTIALFNAGPVWKISEEAMVEVDKDAAIGELLIGLDQVFVHYSRCRQVYVESHRDEEVYRELFAYLRLRNLGTSEHIALSFVPAAPKLAEQNIRDQINAHLGKLDERRIDAFVKALNGQGDCAKVKGAVESLDVVDGVPVCGIIDWDGENKPDEHIYVLGEGLFDNLESAVLNPLTLGLYLLHNFSEHLQPTDYGLAAGVDLHAVVANNNCWQGVADGVMRRVLEVSELLNEVPCPFVKGGSVHLDKRYTHMDGHALEERVKSQYPFLKGIQRSTLLMDVVRRGIRTSGGRTLPRAFLDLFVAVQFNG